MSNESMGIDVSGKMCWLSREQYNGLSDRLRFSQLKVFGESRREYAWRFVLGLMDAEQPATDDMRFGTAVHALLLEAHEIWKPAPGCPVLMKSGKRKGLPCGNRAYYVVPVEAGDQPADLPMQCCGVHATAGLHVPDPWCWDQETADRCRATVKAIRESRSATHWLSDAFTENAILWEFDGLKCRSLLDCFRTDGTIVDVKSVRSVTTESFLERTILDRGYAEQLGFYSLARDAVLGVVSRMPCVLLFHETEPPYRVRPFVLGEDFVEHGRRQCRKWLMELKTCLASNDWRDRWELDDVPELLIPSMRWAYATEFDRESRT